MTLMPDVNVLVAAYRTDAEQHDTARRWLESAVNGMGPVGVTDAVVSGTVRMLTHPRVFLRPSDAGAVLDRLEQLLAARRVQRVVPGGGWWSVFNRLCRTADARGNLVADAAHAAVAIEAGGDLGHLDRDFARFPGLAWTVPRAED